jgi:YegS/Rv2252/BmrU family lipid kinase
MKKAKQAPMSAAQQLASAQARRAKQLRKVEKARARLEKASRKLRTVEESIAVLVHRENHDRAQTSDDASLRALRRRAFLLFNPRSKGVRDGTYRLDQIRDCLDTYGFDVTVGLKTSGNNARELVKEAVKQQLDLVIVAAGDGTLEDIVGKLVGTNTALGILPIGTMNNIARSLGVPLDLAGACALLGMGTTRQIDVGRVITPDKPRGVYFLETAGVGLSALAAPMGQDGEKGRWAQLIELLGKALTFKAANITVTCDDGKVMQAQTQVVTVSNAPLFGKNMLIAPDAKMDDGLLDVALYDDMGKVDLERHFMAIADGKRADDPQVSFQRVRRVRVVADAPLAANADLHVLAEQQTWEIEVQPRTLAVVAGQGIALTLPVDAALTAPPLSGPQPRDGAQPADPQPTNAVASQGQDTSV